MDKNRVFFGENGLTSTSANHIANMAKAVLEPDRHPSSGSETCVMPAKSKIFHSSSNNGEHLAKTV